MTELFEKQVEQKCQPGKGSETCRYLIVGARGFSCAKCDSSMKALLDSKVANGTMSATGDNCNGWDDQEDQEQEFEDTGRAGTKVVYTGKNGYDHDKVHANKYLTVGQIYTIDHEDMGDWHTDTYLVEIPGTSFNSVHFLEAEEAASPLGGAQCPTR